MANRNFRKVQGLDYEIKHLHLDVAIGASGAPTISRGLGVTSIARNSAGLYTITLDDKYDRLSDLNIMQLVSTAEDLKPQLAAEDVDNAKTIQFRMIDSTATETDPSNGSRLLIKIELKNSSVTR